MSEYYAEINVPILKDLPGAKELTVNAAIRWSDYSSSGKVGLTPVETDPGSPSTPKFSLTWRPLDQLMVRGSWGETFRAPSVVDLYSGGLESFPEANDPCNTANWGLLSAASQQRCIQDGVPVGGVVQTNTQLRELRGGNPYLEPEEGENFSYGFVWEPTFVDNFSLTVATSGYPGFEAYYPGSAYVDVIAFSAYHFGYCDWAPPSWRGWLTPQVAIGTYLERALAIDPGKPVFIAQTATSSETRQGPNHAAKDAWLSEAYNYFLDYPNLKAILYFNFYDPADGAQCDWAIYVPGGERYEGYRQTIANPEYLYLSPLEMKDASIWSR